MLNHTGPLPAGQRLPLHKVHFAPTIEDTDGGKVIVCILPD